MVLSPENGHLQRQRQDIQNTNHSNTAHKVGLDVGKIVSIMTRDTTEENQNPQFKSDFALYITLIHSLLCSTFCCTLRTLIQVSICPPILPTIPWLTGLCLVTLPSLSLAKLQYFQRTLGFF